MKAIILFFIALLPVAGAAQVSIATNFTFNVPADHMESTRNGIGGTVAVGYGLGNHFNIGLNVGYTYFDFKPTPELDADITFIPVSVFAELNILTGRVKPYISFEGGLYHITTRQSLVDRKGDVYEDKLQYDKAGIAPGGGLKIGLNDRVDLNLNAKYILVFYNDDLNLNYIGIGAGFIVYLGEKD